MDRWTEDFCAEFCLDPDLIYLNHAAVAPWPARTAHALVEFAEENARRGALGYPGWLQRETILRKRLADLIEAPDSRDIALVKNTSEGLSVVAQGLDWSPGDEVLLLEGDFPSNRIVWEALAERGVCVRNVAQQSDEGNWNAEAALLEALSPRTRVLAVSSVLYASGLRLDLKRLTSECRARGILVIVDAIQSLGAFPFSLSDAPVDAVVADGHKWLLGPEGLALLYIRPELRDRLRLHQYGWHMVEAAGDFDRLAWTPARDARRFECGSPNQLGIVGLEASLALLQQHGIARIAEAITRRVNQLAHSLQEAGYRLMSPPGADRRGGILTVAPRRRAAADIVRELQARRIMVAPRGGGIRFSPHAHNKPEALHYAVEMLKAIDV